MPRTVVSLTFDDGRKSQSIARDLLASHGMHATFYLNSGLIGDSTHLTWEQVDELAADGNEIGGHTIDHVDLATLLQTDEAETIRQVCDDRSALQAHGYDVTSFAYPGGATNPDVEDLVANCGYSSGRWTQGLYGAAGCTTADCPPAETVPPKDAFNIRATGSVDDTTTLSELESFVTNAEQNGGGWVPLIFHDIGTDTDGYSISTSEFTAFLDWLSQRQSRGTVVRTVGEVIAGSPGPNLLENPSFETIGDNGTPECWEEDTYGVNEGDWTETSDAHTGNVAVHGEITSWTSGDRKLIVKRSDECAPPAVPGHSYRVTGWYRGTLPPFFVAIWRDGSGNWISDPVVSPTFASSSGEWSQASWITPRAPDGVTALSIGFAVGGGTGDITIDDLGLSDTAIIPPTVQLVSPTADAYVSGEIPLSANATDDVGVSSVEFDVDGAPIGTLYSSPYSLTWNSTSVPDGTHTITARATDTNGAESIDSANIDVDNTPPDISLDAKPANPSKSKDASFSFSSSDGTAGFLCSLDDAGFTSCTNPAQYSGLGDGAHSFSVKAVDLAGNQSSATGWSWTVDTTPPDISLDAKPANPSKSKDASFSFSSSDGTAGFLCSLDDAGFTSCTNPAQYSGLGDGAHSFSVKAVDLAGNQSSATGWSWTVDTTPPDISLDAKPANPSKSKDASFSFSSSDGTAGFLCSLDDAGFTSCTNPAQYSGLGDGAHSFSVKAVDLAGNQSSATGWSWTVDTTPPTGSPTAPASGSYLRQTVTLSSNSADSGSGVASVVFQYRPTGGSGWTTIETDTSSPYRADWDTSAVTDGPYDLRVVTTDRAGNEFVSNAVTVTVDNTPPTGSLTAPASGAFVTSRLTVRCSSADAGSGVASVVFQIAPAVAGPWQTEAAPAVAPWSALMNLTGIAQGSAYLRAVITDQAGNVFTSPALRVTLDNTPPTSSILCNGRSCRALFKKTVKVTIRARDGASGVSAIRYTLNGAVPTAKSRLYRAPLELFAGRTVRWRVWDRAGNVSPTRTQAIRIKRR